MESIRGNDLSRSGNYYVCKGWVEGIKDNNGNYLYKKMKYYTIILTILLISCSRNLVLEESYLNKENSRDIFIFKTDSTFIYDYALGFHSKYSEGLWNLEKGLFLNSKYFDLNNFPIEIKKESKNIKNIKLKVIQPDVAYVYDTIYNYSFEINNKIYNNGYSNDFIIEEDKLPVKLRVLIELKNMYHTPVNKVLRSESIVVSDNHFSEITLVTPVTLNSFYYVDISNEKIKLLSKKLKWKDELFRLKR